MRSNPDPRPLRSPRATLALALALAIPAASLQPTTAAASPLLAFAKAKKKKSSAPSNKLTAEAAEEARADVIVRGKAMIDDDPEAAAELYAEEARKLGDPILFLEAARAYQAVGDKERSIDPVERGMEEARISLDILYFLKDPRADATWEIVAESAISGLVDDAKGHLEAAEALITEIERENEPPPPPPASEGKKERKPIPKDGRGLIAGGSLLTAIGVGGLGMMGAGIAMGLDAQEQVEDPTVVGADFDEADARGQRANTLSYAGIAVGAVGLIGGVTLLVLGVKKRKAYRDGRSETALRWTPQVGPTGAGLRLSGRF